MPARRSGAASEGHGQAFRGCRGLLPRVSGTGQAPRDADSSPAVSKCHLVASGNRTEEA